MFSDVAKVGCGVKVWGMELRCVVWSQGLGCGVKVY